MMKKLSFLMLFLLASLTTNIWAETTPVYTAVDLVLDGSAPVPVPEEYAQPILEAEAISVVVDFTPNTVSAHMALAAASNTNGSSFVSYILNYVSSNDVGFGVRWGDGGECLTNSGITVNTRQQVVLSLTQTTVVPYLNGSHKNNATEPSSSSWTIVPSEVANVNALYIGGFAISGNTNKYPFSGTIHSIRFYTKDLTATEVASLTYDNLVPTVSDKYTVIIPSETGGTVSVTRNDVALNNGDEIVAGDILTITAEPTEGYEFGTLTVNNEPFTNGSQYIVQENENVFISVSFTKLPPVPLFTATNLVFDGSENPIKIPNNFANKIFAEDVTVVVDYSIESAPGNSVDTNIPEYAFFSFGNHKTATVNANGIDISINAVTILTANKLRWRVGTAGMCWGPNNDATTTGNRHLVYRADNAMVNVYIGDANTNSYTNTHPNKDGSSFFSSIQDYQTIHLGGVQLSDGTFHTDYNFKGTIHSIRFYKELLSTSEVSELPYSDLKSDIQNVSVVADTDILSYTLTTLDNHAIDDLRAVETGTTLKLTISNVDSEYQVENVSWGEDILSGTNGEYTFIVNDSRTLTVQSSLIPTHTITIVNNEVAFTLKNSMNGILAGTGQGDNGEDVTETTVLGDETLTLYIHQVPNGKVIEKVTWGEENATKSENGTIYTFTADGTKTLTIVLKEYQHPVGTATYDGSYVTTISMSSQEWNKGFVLDLRPADNNNVYLDYTNGGALGYATSFPITAGETVTVNLSYKGSDINPQYLYIDWNRNGVFETDECIFTASAVARTATSFVVPTDKYQGIYRARFEVDTDNTDPNTLNDIETNAAKGSMIADFDMNYFNENNKPTDIEENVENAVVLYYANGYIYTNVACEIVIYDMSGKIVRRSQLAPVAVDDLANGIYIVKVAGKTLKFVK